ncbi:vWA domain-containing protein [Methylotenera sp.]|uniref:vWA domain-containing protein n=1 Tax=Methylotenera sp. TaxID=2051956 RepID=UPI002733A63A|nr:vWA domain-containing protein [Methylotenera sp.]MDP3211718.1 vWA domain-containing protein [Methylotenera sp.]
MVNPKIPLSLNVNNYMFVIDITQSMNVKDMHMNKRPISRLNYALQLISMSLKELPCGTKVSIALFANAEVVPLYVPIEICENFGVIQDTLKHLEWRMAWRGSSHLRLGLIDAGSVSLTLPEPTKIIFLTDGDEAAPLNAITKIDLQPMQGSSSWLLAGIGSQEPSPIPKFNSKDEIIGYWSQYATKIEPSQIVNEDSVGKRDDSIASDPHEYYLSALREDYLKEVVSDINANYVRADLQAKFLTAINKLPSAGNSPAHVETGWIFALISAFFVIADYLPKRKNLLH